MRYLKWRVILFFVVETLAVAAMIALFNVSRRPWCGRFTGCTMPSGDGLILGIPAILGELAILAAALKVQRAVWGALLGLGFCFLMATLMIFLPLDLFTPAPYRWIFARWHLTAGGLLGAAGMIGAIRAGFMRARVRVGQA